MLQITGDYEHDVELCAQAARAWLADETLVVLDTETTDLHGYLVQIAVIDRDGTTLLDTLINPQAPISPGAARIHGITAERVRDAPTYGAIHQQLTELLAGRRIVIYNASFDLNILYNEVERHLGPGAHFEWLKSLGGVECAMELYSTWTGDWNDYHGSYRWQRLPGGDHSALGDCRATLAMLRRVAEEAQQ